MSKAPEEKAKANLGGKVITCHCRSEYQDARYGKGKRWFNQKQADKKKNQYTCTVCGTSTAL